MVTIFVASSYNKNTTENKNRTTDCSIANHKFSYFMIKCMQFYDKIAQLKKVDNF